MSPSSSSLPSMAALATNLGNPPALKLTHNNWLFWKALVFPPLRCAFVFGLLDGTDDVPPKLLDATYDAGKRVRVPNPEYSAWVACDQYVQGWLNNSLSPDILAHVLDKPSTAETWATISAKRIQKSSRISLLHFGTSLLPQKIDRKSVV